MDTPFALVSSVPDVVWSAVIASLLTLAGVMVSNRDSTKRLLLQLKHDASEKAKERIAMLRRDVYLHTVEELVKANAHLAGLLQKDLTKENLGDELQGFFAAAAKLQLVAEPETALLVSRLQAEYAELTFELMAHLLPASYAKIDIKIADDLFGKAQAEVARVLTAMVKQNESGEPDPKIFRTLQSTVDFQQAQSTKYAEARSEAWERFNECGIAFQRFLLTRIRDLGPKQIPVLIAIRRDLGLTGDLSEFEAEAKLQSQRIEGKFNAIIEILRVSQPLAQSDTPLRAG
jgi:hypothetical protein